MFQPPARLRRKIDTIRKYWAAWASTKRKHCCYKWHFNSAGVIRQFIAKRTHPEFRKLRVTKQNIKLGKKRILNARWRHHRTFVPHGLAEQLEKAQRRRHQRASIAAWLWQLQTSQYHIFHLLQILSFATTLGETHYFVSRRDTTCFSRWRCPLRCHGKASGTDDW